MAAKKKWLKKGKPKAFPKRNKKKITPGGRAGKKNSLYTCNISNSPVKGMMRRWLVEKNKYNRRCVVISPYPSPILRLPVRYGILYLYVPV